MHRLLPSCKMRVTFCRAMENGGMKPKLASSRNRPPHALSRRQFVQNSTLATAGMAIASSLPWISKGGPEEGPVIKVGLIGCGGRGTGAAGNVLEAAKNVQIVGLADLFSDRLETC